ncbi:MAG: aminoacyl-tRNA hydrolase [Saprospiraceae bacterium]|nr:aminoacyl-tRNA hydrolase [Saprospiraceae bacterium]
MWSWIKKLFSSEEAIVIDPMKYLIAGLGNIGPDYAGTRHNIGFEVLDTLAQKFSASWNLDNLAGVTEIKHKGRTLILIKPTTYMNKSGKAVNYWIQKHKIEKENVLVVLDDLNLDFGTLRLKTKGSDGGHNGLKDIDLSLGGNDYARLRIGIGSEFRKGQQVDFVLGKWDKAELKDLPFILESSADAVLSYASVGPKFTMEKFNKKVI